MAAAVWAALSSAVVVDVELAVKLVTAVELAAVVGGGLAGTMNERCWGGGFMRLEFCRCRR